MENKEEIIEPQNKLKEEEVEETTEIPEDQPSESPKIEAVTKESK